MTSKLIQNEPYGRQKTLPAPSRKKTENKHEKRTSKTRKINLSQQGNGKRAQQESTVEQRVYICSMHPHPQSKDEKLKNMSKIMNEYSNTCNPCSKNMI